MTTLFIFIHITQISYFDSSSIINTSPSYDSILAGNAPIELQ